MADSDPISDYTPAKRRKITHPLKEWDEADDSGDDLFEEHETAISTPWAAMPHNPLSLYRKRTTTPS
jgi:hypothetical protein